MPFESIKWFPLHATERGCVAPYPPEPSLRQIAREDREYFNDRYDLDPDDYDDTEAA